MSIQIVISAFNLSDLGKQLKSKNKQLAEDAIEAFEEFAEEVDLDEDLIDDGKVRINDLILSGAKESTETVAEVSAINFLVANSASPIEGDCENEWPWQSLNDMNVQFQKRFDERTRILFNYCVEGRPYIGKEFDSDAGFYWYLTNSEVVELHTGLDKVYVVVAEIIDSGAMNEQDFDGNLVDTLQAFMETLDSVRETKMDLFGIAC